MPSGESTRNRKTGAGGIGVALVLIDQTPLRERVAAECSEAMARLERARAGWHHFERKDKPAFARWRAREFGALPEHGAGGGDTDSRLPDACPRSGDGDAEGFPGCHALICE